LYLKKILGEYFGTAILALAIVGSGIMGSNLTKDGALSLFINALGTAIGLAVAIGLVGKISGAHLNPAVTLIMLITKRIQLTQFALYSIAQILGAISGVVLGNYIFGANAIESSSQLRNGTNLFISEIIATAVLVWIILSNLENFEKIATYVPLWIFGGILFTSSTAFANPAITIGRGFTNSATGIAPESIITFICAQIIGAVLGLGAAKVFKNE
jgi:glycerol uptake facilitator-like aquaporin